MVKYAKHQDLKITPNPIYIEKGQLIFDIDLSFLEDQFKGQDSIVFEFLTETGSSETIHFFPFKKGITPNTDGIIHHEAHIDIPFTLNQDSISLDVRMTEFKNGRSLSTGPLPVAWIFKK